MTPAKIELGCKLFFDRRPSTEGRVSRSSWRDSKFALADGRAVSERGLKKERRIVGRPYLSSGEPSLRGDSREGV
jgi:cytochrome c peroxidase